MIYKPFINATQIYERGQDITNNAIVEKVDKIEEWLIKCKTQKDKNMLYLVMYDIENDKIRTQVAKYLIKKGCMRIQKSVYLTKSSRTTYNDIHETLKDINTMYNNADSIFLLPVPEEKFVNMKVIGLNVEFDIVTKHTNVLFF